MGATISSLSRGNLRPPKTSLPSSPTRIGREGKFLSREERRQTGVLVLNRYGRILYLNGEVQNIFDSTDENISGKSAENVSLQEVLSDFLLEKSPSPPPSAPDKRTFPHRGRVYQVRSVPLPPHGRTRRDVYFLLLIKEIVRDSRADSYNRRRRFSD